MTVLENAGTLELSVELSGPSGQDVGVDYSLVDGTAVLGEDYQAPNGTLPFPAGETVGVISLLILDNPLDELDESFSVLLSSPVNATLVEPTTTAVTITDDDDPPQISWQVMATTVE